MYSQFMMRGQKNIKLATELLRLTCRLRDSTYGHCNVTNIYGVANSLLLFTNSPFEQKRFVCKFNTQ